MTTSRSTARLRLTALALVALLVLVAVSERSLAAGLAGLWLQLAGLLCVAAAALGRVWTSVFIAGFKDTRLVRCGPYARLRHPLYALSLLAMLGIALTTRSAVLGTALLVLSAAQFVVAARGEDSLLGARHGADFARYAATVPAFVPGRSPGDVPDSLEIRPRVLWKSFVDAASLFGYWTLLVAADALQRSGRTPSWFMLP